MTGQPSHCIPIKSGGYPSSREDTHQVGRIPIKSGGYPSSREDTHQVGRIPIKSGGYPSSREDTHECLNHICCMSLRHMYKITIPHTIPKKNSFKPYPSWNESTSHQKGKKEKKKHLNIIII